MRFPEPRLPARRREPLRHELDGILEQLRVCVHTVEGRLTAREDRRIRDTGEPSLRLVTLEDVLEEIVGEIQDEHDVDEELLRQDSDGSWIINAVAHVEELKDLFGLELVDRDFDTVAGFVVSGFGRVPRTGETLDIQGLRVEVLQADRRRVQRVRISPLQLPGQARANP